LIGDDLHLHESHPARKHLMNRETPYETVRYVGSKVREVEQRDRAALEADGFDININLTVGGQIAGLAPEVHSIHPAAEQRSREQGLSFPADRRIEVRQADSRPRVQLQG
jgi:predicted proteasome-type protease